MAPNADARKWRANRGDSTLRLDYDLSGESTVLDVGGFDGQWASDIVAMYRCRVHVFEPIPAQAERIRRRFARNPLVTVHPFGLASRTGWVEAWASGDASSHVRRAGEPVSIELRAAGPTIADLGCDEIHLMKVNIEGAEYELLNYLVDTGLIGRVRDLQVQFHEFVPDALSQAEAVRSRLAKTHYPTYQYDFVWENWRRREARLSQ